MGSEAENAFMSAFEQDMLNDDTGTDTALKGQTSEHEVPLSEAILGLIKKQEGLIKELQEDVRSTKGLVQRNYEEILSMVDMQKSYYDEFISFVRSVRGDERRGFHERGGISNCDSSETVQHGNAEDLYRLTEENDKLRHLIASIAAESDSKSDALEDKESQIDSLMEEIDSLKDQLYGVNPQADGSQNCRHPGRKRRKLGFF